jgi:hypothetical protein
MIALMESNYSLPVNLGNPDEYTIREFAEMIRSMVDIKVELKFMPATEVCEANPDKSTARKISGGVSIIVFNTKRTTECRSLFPCAVIRIGLWVDVRDGTILQERSCFHV